MRRLGIAAGVLGCGLLVAGAALIYPPAGFVVAGVLGIFLSYLILDAMGPNR